MPFTETENTIDTTLTEGNINAFIRANQAAMLATVNGGTALKSFSFVEDNLANLDKPNLPTLRVTGIEEIEASEGSDILQMDYQIEYESIVFSKSPVTISPLAKKYGNALKRLLKNIKVADMFAGLTVKPILQPKSEVQINYGEVLQADSYSGFIQQFNLRAVYRLYASIN